MIQIRKGLFETNSSSVHAVTLLTKEEYDRWNTEEDMYLMFREGKVFTKEEAIEYLKEKHPSITIENDDDWYDLCDWYDLYTPDAYEDSRDYCEKDEDIYTKDGKEFVVLSYFGYDG